MATAVGIDIGSYMIKLAAVKKSFGNVEIEKLVSTYNPTGKFLPSDEVEFNKLAVEIKKLLQESGYRGSPIQLGLPEGMVHTSIIQMPNLSEAELASSIHWEAEQHIPIPLEEVNLEYEILYQPKKDDIGEKMKVLLVAARTDTINRVIALFSAAGVEVVGLETVLLGVYRSLRSAFNDQGAVLVCHMGALSTDIMIVHNGDLVLSYTIQSGGLALTRSIEKGLEMPPQQAEEYKRAYGMDPAQLEGKVRQTLSGVMNVLVNEIRKTVQYYQSTHQMAPIRAMWLTGGSAYLPGITSYFAEAFSFEVNIVNPATVLPIKQGVNIPGDVAAFTPAIGFALLEE
jgi:type IV pilus assembly protein PilM